MNWHTALAQARGGDLSEARRLHESSAGGALSEYFYGRCLAEAGEEPSEAAAILDRTLLVDPANLLYQHSLALALAQCADSESKSRAAAIWQKVGLPHDLDLLGQTAWVIEMSNRPLQPQPKISGLAWPEGLERPPEGFPGAQEEAIEKAASARPEPDKLTRPAASKSHGFFHKRELARVLARLDKFFRTSEIEKTLIEANLALGRGLESAEVHLMAGIAADEADDPDRARAHLARAMALDPNSLMARTWLGRVYWRLSWTDLAVALWRSLPVEGPYDSGRHYHLGLGYAALGDRRAASRAMDVALRDFYYDTRHFFIQRAYDRWLAAVGANGRT